jgi:MFS family permease
MVVELVGPADVGNAVGLNSSLFNLARSGGPALGGIVVASLGVAVCFFINSVSFLAVLVALALMRTNELHAVARPAAGRGTQLAEDPLRHGYASSGDILVLVAAIGTWLQLPGDPAADGWHVGDGPAGLEPDLGAGCDRCWPV